jgi:hypothetical protein
MLIFIISTLWMVVGLSLPQAPNAYPAFRTGNLLSAAGGGKVHYRATTRVAAKQRARHGRTIVAPNGSTAASCCKGLWLLNPRQSQNSQVHGMEIARLQFAER